jgi:DMSO/TMAO reductase YedYZ molybdopterin-dependent catalytic subunit
MKKQLIMTLFLIVLSACAPNTNRASTVLPPLSTSTKETLPTAKATLPPTIAAPVPTATLVITQVDNGICDTQPVIVPTLPAKIPETGKLDETTGLHMTGKVQVIDLASYRLKVSGKVEHPLSLSYEDLRCMPKISAAPILVCPGVFTDQAVWSGVPFSEVLRRAGVQSGAKTVRMVAADRYEFTISLETAMNPQNYLAYEWEGKPLPIQHGFPLRAVFPDQPGNQWGKWLLELVVE